MTLKRISLIGLNKKQVLLKKIELWFLLGRIIITVIWGWALGVGVRHCLEHPHRILECLIRVPDPTFLINLPGKVPKEEVEDGKYLGP